MTEETRKYLDAKFAGVASKEDLKALATKADLGQQIERVIGICGAIADAVGAEIHGEEITEAEILTSYREDIDKLTQRVKALEEKKK